MYYINPLENGSESDLELYCDECNSYVIHETASGYVCSECGIVLEHPKMEYHHPYGENTLQYAPLGTTQIGSRHERRRHPNSRMLSGLQNIQNRKNNEKVMDITAKKAISVLSSHLDLPRTLYQTYFLKYKEIRKNLTKGTKFRAPEKLVPVVIYYCTKYRNIPIDIDKLLDISVLEKKEFNKFRTKMVEFWQEYMRRNRKEFILNRILHLCESKGFGMRFYELSQTLLDKLWEIIKCTKDDVIAGLIASIITLCQYKDQISINAICKFMNIRMSTIQSQVKRTIFERLRIPGFSTLIKSAGILEKILKKLGIFSAAKNESEGTYVLDAAEKRRAQIKAYQEINNDEDEEISQELQLQENHPQNHENFIIELTPNKSELEYSSYQFIICHKDTQNLIDLSLKIPKDKIGNKNYPDFEPTYFKINVLDLNSKGTPSMRI